MPALRGEYNPAVPSRVIFGRGRVDELKEEVGNLGGKRALLISGKTVAEKTDAVHRTAAGLGNTLVGTFSRLTQRAPMDAAVQVTRMALDAGADTLVGVGGSTISDASRMIGVMMAHDITTVERLRELDLQHDGLLPASMVTNQLPLQVSIPTTLSAGEFNMGSGCVLNDRAGHKIRVRHPGLYANLIVLDLEITIGTPNWLWLSTGIKALDHCIERLYTTGNQPAIDAPILAAAEMIFTYLPKSRQTDKDPEARLKCLMAAWMSMMGAPNFATGLSHAIGHILGVKYSVGHGYTSCVTQPYVMEFNRPVSAAKQSLLARSAGFETSNMSNEAAAEAAARAVDDFVLGLGMPHRIRELEIPEADLPHIAQLVLTDGGCRDNPIPITSTDQVMEVLKKAF